ncbi:copper fist DNA binding domain-containing protein [Tricladium varicosporioides]|nr:copper fist DNA binding domain-containing protein [Hymenoscyphus varicosporioides]
MPLINGYKYSCEPCIRGHRATSCAHTDRILIEVRKPGRPLESCGHQLDTCNCGRLQEIFSIGDGKFQRRRLNCGVKKFKKGNLHCSASLDQAFIAKPPFVATPSPSTSSRDSRSKSKAKPRQTSKATKKTGRRKSTASASTTQSEESLGQMGQSPLPTSPNPTSPPSGQYTPTYTISPSQTPQPSMWPPVPPQSGHAPTPQASYLPYQASHRFDSHPQAPYGYPPSAQASQYGVQSRVENVGMASDPQRQQGDGDGSGQSYVRSQYIAASQDPPWNTPR